jgi:hypothetical protein
MNNSRETTTAIAKPEVCHPKKLEAASAAADKSVATLRQIG